MLRGVCREFLGHNPGDQEHFCLRLGHQPATHTLLRSSVFSPRVLPVPESWRGLEYV